MRPGTSRLRLPPTPTLATFDFAQTRLWPLPTPANSGPLQMKKKKHKGREKETTRAGQSTQLEGASTQTRLIPACRYSTGLHVEHRRPKAGDAPHDGLLQVERRGPKGSRAQGPGLWGAGARGTEHKGSKKSKENTKKKRKDKKRNDKERKII